MTEPTATFPIRTATPEDARTFFAPLMVAFGDEMTDSQWADWCHTLEPERLIAAFDGDVPVGTAGAYTFRMTVPGDAEVAAAGVTLVGVEPGHRRRGVLRALMRHQLDDVRERGEPVAILWASEAAIYQRFGYGLGTLSGSFEIDRGRTWWLRPAEADGRMRLVSVDEALATIPPVYERMRAVTPGALTRTADWWRWGPLHDADYMRRGSGPKFRYLYEVGGGAEGYAIYRPKGDWDDRGPKGQLQVVEVVALTPRALRGVWGFLFGVDLMRTVSAERQPVPHPLQLALADPRALGLVAGDGIWVRLVDLPAALAARRYGAPGELVLEVADAFCPWNAGRWRLAAAGAPGCAVATVERADAPADLAVDVADLGAAYLGAFRLSELARAGRVEELVAGALRRADALLASDRAPWCVTMF
jgi:predicted acetyltransferase